MWACQWKMPFNIDKCEFMVFGDAATPDSDYTLGTTQLAKVDTTKYLGVCLQANLQFDTHIAEKISKATKILGCIKHTLYDAPQKAKLMAYTSLCRPILEYADTVWDPTDKQTSYNIEMVQRKAVRFIKKLKGRQSVTDASTELGLQSLEDRRKNHRLCLLHKILSDEDRHDTLTSAYEELVNARQHSTMTTRAAARGEPNAIYARTRLFHNSFLPKTIRDLRLN